MPNLTTDYEKEIRSLGESQGVDRYTVGLVLLKKSKILLVRRVETDFLGGMFELPGGGVEFGEDLRAATIREGKEELGIDIQNIARCEFGFDYLQNKKKYRQYNLWITNFESEITLNPLEHSELVWAEESQLDDIPMTEKMKKTVYEILKIK